MNTWMISHLTLPEKASLGHPPVPGQWARTGSQPEKATSTAPFRPARLPGLWASSVLKVPCLSLNMGPLRLARGPGGRKMTTSMMPWTLPRELAWYGHQATARGSEWQNMSKVTCAMWQRAWAWKSTPKTIPEKTTYPKKTWVPLRGTNK